MKNIKYLAVAGNGLYILWILYNGVEEFKTKVTTVHIAAYIGIILLLILNIFLFTRKEK